MIDLSRIVEDFVSEARTLCKKVNHGLDYMKEIYENLNDIQHSSSQPSTNYTTHKGGELPSQH